MERLKPCKPTTIERVSIKFFIIALAILISGSLLGEYLGVKDVLKKLWFWLGNQGGEYLEISRGWQFFWLLLQFQQEPFKMI